MNLNQRLSNSKPQNKISLKIEEITSILFDLTKEKEYFKNVEPTIEIYNLNNTLIKVDKKLKYLEMNILNYISVKKEFEKKFIQVFYDVNKKDYKIFSSF